MLLLRATTTLNGVVLSVLFLWGEKQNKNRMVRVVLLAWSR